MEAPEAVFEEVWNYVLGVLTQRKSPHIGFKFTSYSCVT